MTKRCWEKIACDPRKILIAISLVSALIMRLGVMDYRFQGMDYLILVLISAAQIPLLFLGKIRYKLQITLSDRAGWFFFIASLLLVSYNFSILGLPYLLVKIQTGMDLTAFYGDYYHHRLKLTFLIWALLNVMIPMSLIVKGKVLKYVLFFWPITVSFLIQIKAPFLFGLLYYGSLAQLIGKKIKFSQLVIVGLLVCILFVVINATRSEFTMQQAAAAMGVSKPWASLSPLIWYPLSYIGGPLLNCFNNLNYDLFRFNLYPFLLITPAAFWPMEAREFARFSNLDVLWASNNQVAAPCQLSYMFGVGGMILFIFGLSLILSIILLKKFYHSKLLLSFFITAVNIVTLFPVANYFTDSRFAGDLFMWFLCLSLCKVRFVTECPTETKVKAATADGKYYGGTWTNEFISPKGCHSHRL